MTELTLRSYNASVKIKGDADGLLRELSDPDNRKVAEKMIPSVSLVTGHCANPNSEILIRHGEKFYVRESYPCYEVVGRNINYIDILALTEHMLERGRQEEGVYNLHSSAVGLENKCVVVNGVSKSGKTLVSLKLLEDCGMKFLANERSLIHLRDSLLVGGCRTLDLSPYHQQNFSNLKGKSELTLDKIVLPYSIVSIVQPIIDSGAKSPQIITVKLQDAEWALYPEFTVRIRGDNRRLRGDDKKKLHIR